jgi:peptidoglycan/xylan/chitin deacetylase (PgdA/CDA1 family)
VRVALTFDAEHPDRPRSSPGAAASVLDSLLSAGARATFFVQGRWARAFPDLTARMADQGHLVGCHSHFHARLPMLSEAGLEFDLRESEWWIRAATGRSPRPWLRAPWGSMDGRVAAALDRHGFGHVGWDVVAEDWDESRSAEQVARDVLEGAEAVGDGAVVLLHTWPASAAEALPRILEGVKDLGARTVTVAELIDRDLGATPDPAVAALNSGSPA